MLRGLRLGIAFAILLAPLAFVLAPAVQLDIVLPPRGNQEAEPFLADDGPVRSERSANISHIIGVSRKIQLIVNKIMYLQILSDGSVNGTDNDNDYTVLQRASINNYQIKIQGVVTCNFLCMDRCGLLYGSKEFTDECIFNEMMESHHFNTYSSAKYSNEKRTLYLALNKKGVPRKVQTKAKASLGKLETYTNVLTKPVSLERVEGLALKIARARLLSGSVENGSSHHLVRHHRYQFCPNVPMTKLDEKNKFRCRKREKRKKKRKCREEDDDDDDECQTTPKKKTLGKCEEEEGEEGCQKRLHGVRQKRKSRNGSDSDSVKCLGEKCADDKEKKRKKRLKAEKKTKFSEKTAKSKCDSELNCLNKRKRVRKEKTISHLFSSGEDSSGATASLLWSDTLIGFKNPSSGKLSSSSMTIDSGTEKPSTDDYEIEEEDQTEKMAEEEQDDLSSENGYEWATQSSSSSSSFSLHRD